MKAGISHCDEQQLVQRLRRGERAALEEMIVMHGPHVARLVSRLIGWSTDADDLVQDVFVAALRGSKKFRGDSGLSTWLTRIAINTCRSHHRKRLLRATFWKNWRPLEIAADASLSAVEQERANHVTHAVRRLKGKYREVIVLHYLEEMPVEEMSHVLGQTRNTIEVQLHRARQMLQEMLQPMIESEKK